MTTDRPQGPTLEPAVGVSVPVGGPPTAPAPLPGGTQELATACVVKINGAPLPPPAAQCLIDAAVHQEVAGPSMATFTLLNWDMHTLRFPWSDDPMLLAPGSRLEICMGSVDLQPSVFQGEIVALEGEFARGETATLTVRGYDLRQRMLRNQRTRTYKQMKDSEIAQQIAGQHNLACLADDSGARHEYLLQHNQSDLEFLQQRAHQIGFEVAMQGSRLLFRKPPLRQVARVTLEHDKNLLEFSPRLTILGPARALEVRGWSVKEKRAVVGRADATDQTGMGNATAGAVRPLADSGEATVVTVPVDSKAEADAMARGQYNALALGYITGSGMCIGNPQLAAGEIVRIAGVGTRFSGKYYLTAVSHSYSPRHGYRTAFEVRRNAT